MSLPDAVRVFPAHGAGSACGKNLSTEKQSTIGEQRLFNYACQPMSEPDFVALVTAGQPPAPDYFVYDAILNRKDRAVYDADQPLTALDTTAMLTAIAAGAVVVDARDAQDFAAGYPACRSTDRQMIVTGLMLARHSDHYVLQRFTPTLRPRRRSPSRTDDPLAYRGDGPAGAVWDRCDAGVATARPAGGAS